MLTKQAVTNVVPTTDDYWFVSPSAAHGFAVPSRDDAIEAAKVYAANHGTALYIYNRERIVELTMSALEAASDIMRQIEQQRNDVAHGVTSTQNLLEDFQYRILVGFDSGQWNVSKFDSDMKTFNNKNETIQYAYNIALEDGLVVYIYDEDGNFEKTLDPEDELEYSDDVLQSLQEQLDYEDAMNIDDILKELDADE